MGIFDMFKSNKLGEDWDKDPFTSLTMSQGENNSPTIDDVLDALKVLDKGETDFVSLAQYNQGLEIEVVQAIGSMGSFTIEALTAADPDEEAEIYYKEHLDEYSLEYYFQNFFERQRVEGIENFEER